MNTKLCRKCNTRKPVTEFGKNSVKPDGLNYYCKTCFNAFMKEYRKKTKGAKITPTVAKSMVKLDKFLEALPENDFQVNKAYMAISNVKTLASADDKVRRFFSTLSPIAIDAFITKWGSFEDMSAFEEYFNRARTTGTLSEQRDALKLKAHIMGLLTDKHEIRAGGISPDKREEKLLAIQKIIEGEIVNSEEVEDES